MKEGFFDVRNPFQPKLINRIFVKDVDAIVFCTKNPHPILPYLKYIKKPMLFQVTLTGYKKDIERNVPDKKMVLEDILELSNVLGKENVIVRYDPIFLSDSYTVDYHIKAFRRICEVLDGKIQKIIISFLDEYKNVIKNQSFLKYHSFLESDFEKIGREFSQIAHSHHILVHTCFEERNLSEYGMDVGECLSHQTAYMMTGKKFSDWKARKGRKCHCVQMIDIGAYNTCNHLCRYCYANFDEKKIHNYCLLHNPNSSLLIGEIENGDIIKERK